MTDFGEGLEDPSAYVEATGLAGFVEWVAAEDALIDEEASQVEQGYPEHLASPEAKLKHVGEAAFAAGRKEEIMRVAERLTMFVGLEASTGNKAPK